MPMADKKKCWHFIYALSEEAAKLKAIDARLQAIKAAWLAHNPSTTGTPLDGQVASVNGWIADLNTAATGAVADGFASHEDRRKARHRPPSALGEGL